MIESGTVQKTPVSVLEYSGRHSCRGPGPFRIGFVSFVMSTAAAICVGSIAVLTDRTTLLRPSEINILLESMISLSIGGVVSGIAGLFQRSGRFFAIGSIIVSALNFCLILIFLVA